MEQNNGDSKSNGGAIQENCPVCLEATATEITVCCHKFCSSCLDKWSSVNNTCPLCRSKLNNNSTARSYDNNFIYTIPWTVYPEDTIYRPQSNYSRIDSTHIDFRIRPDLFVEEPFTNTPVFNTNNVAVAIQQWPAEFRGMPYLSVRLPSITDT